MRCLSILSLLFIGLHAIAQTDSTGRYTGVGIDVGHPADLAYALLDTGTGERLFQNFNGPLLSLTLLRGDSVHFTFLSLRGMIDHNVKKRDVQRLDGQGEPVLGERSSEERIRDELLLDIELGHQFVKSFKGFSLSAGPGVYVSIARSKKEIITDNDLTAYVGEDISFTTRSRGEFGLRLRAEASQCFARRWRFAVSASYQGGIRSIPDVTTLRVQWQSDGQLALTRIIDARDGFDAGLADRLVGQAGIRYMFK